MIELFGKDKEYNFVPIFNNSHYTHQLQDDIIDAHGCLFHESWFDTEFLSTDDFKL